MEISSDHVVARNKNSQSGFIKADQLHYFDKSKLDFYILGRIDNDLLDELLELIIELEVQDRLKSNLNNIKETSKC